MNAASGIVPSTAASDPQVQVWDGGRLFVVGQFAPWLQAHRLDTVERLMEFDGGRRMRAVPGRSTVRLELSGPAGTWVFFLKRYEPEYLSRLGRWLRRLRWPAAQDEARREWEAIHRLRAQGFKTAEPVAVGQSRRGGLVVRSLVMTAEVANARPAHELWPTLDAAQRRQLIGALARWTARFHAAGYVHKDLYLSHFLVTPGTEDARPELVCIDLQRVTQPRWLRTRWRVKDLAQLAYSARAAGARPVELLRFYQIYAGRTRLQTSDRRLIRRIWRRVRRLEQRAPRYDVLWDQPGVRPQGT